MPTRNEINFISMWRECSDERGDALDKDVSAYMEAGGCLVDWAWLYVDHHALGTVSHFTLTLRGVDLIATADAIGFDPATALADDEPRPEAVAPACSECGDTGEVAVLGDFKNPCACMQHTLCEREEAKLKGRLAAKRIQLPARWFAA